MIDLEIYEPEIIFEHNGIISGKGRKLMREEDMPNITPVIRAFLDDPDLQEMTIASGNIGFVYTYRKQYKRR